MVQSVMTMGQQSGMAQPTMMQSGVAMAMPVAMAPGICNRETLPKIAESCGSAAMIAYGAAVMAKDKAQCTKAIADYSICIAACA